MKKILSQLQVFTLLTVLLVACNFLLSCNEQTKSKSENPITTSGRVGGECEAGYCDLMYLGMPEKMNAVDTSAGWFEKGQKLIISGTAYQLDGKTPAPNVIIYYHHTDNDGYYSPIKNKPETQTRHGHIRGWMKTDNNGKYTLYTIKPAPYPNDSLPSHIHWLIKEPNIPNEYWTDDLMFEDDKLLLPYTKKHKPSNWGGNGIVKTTVKDNIQIAKKDFILGLNIPNYPVNK